MAIAVSHYPESEHSKGVTMENTPEQHTENTTYESPKETLFSSGTFVIGLIVIGLFVTLITWSVSFAALFFGAVGTMLSVASCSLDHKNLRFQIKREVSFNDENWAYFAIRAVAGAVFGTATALLAVSDFAHTHWATIAVLAIFGAYVLDTLLFKRSCSKD